MIKERILTLLLFLWKDYSIKIESNGKLMWIPGANTSLIEVKEFLWENNLIDESGIPKIKI